MLSLSYDTPQLWQLCWLLNSAADRPLRHIHYPNHLANKKSGDLLMFIRLLDNHGIFSLRSFPLPSRSRLPTQKTAFIMIFADSTYLMMTSVHHESDVFHGSASTTSSQNFSMLRPIQLRWTDLFFCLHDFTKIFKQMRAPKLARAACDWRGYPTKLIESLGRTTKQLSWSK